MYVLWFITCLKCIFHVQNSAFHDGKVWPGSGSRSAWIRIVFAPWIRIRIRIEVKKTWSGSRGSRWNQCKSTTLARDSILSMYSDERRHFSKRRNDCGLLYNLLISEYRAGVDYWKTGVLCVPAYGYRVRILGRNPDKSLKSFLPCYSQSPLPSFALGFLFLQTHAASYSFDNSVTVQCTL